MYQNETQKSHENQDSVFTRFVVHGKTGQQETEILNKEKTENYIKLYKPVELRKNNDVSRGVIPPWY